MKAEGKPKSNQFHFYVLRVFSLLLPSFTNECIRHNEIFNTSEITWKYLHWQLREAHFSWEYNYLSFFTLDYVMWEAFTKASSLGSLHAHWGWLLLCLEQLWSYSLYWVANWRDTSPLLRKFPDICKVKEKWGLSSEAFWNFSARTDRLSSTWLSYAADGQQGPLAVGGAMPKDKCSLCLGSSLAVYIQAKCHGTWLT